jgi:hypothetical protein
VLEAISRSVALDEGSAEVVPADESISASVASVQLPQQVEWADAGLTLYFPADWTVSVDPVEGLTASPDALSVVAMIQGQAMPWSAGLDLREVIMAAAGDQSMLAEPVAVTVAGYPGVIYDIVDDADTRLHIRALTIAMDDREQAAVFFFGTDEAGWAAFRPVADAFMSSIEQADGGLSARRTGAIHALASRVPPITPLPFRQDSSSSTGSPSPCRQIGRPSAGRRIMTWRSCRRLSWNPARAPSSRSAAFPRSAPTPPWNRR